MVHREDVRSGFDSLPDTFSDLFTGNNDGTLMVVTDEAARTRP
jgi:NADPH-dependent curcumin reductase CurA